MPRDRDRLTVLGAARTCSSARRRDRARDAHDGGARLDARACASRRRARCACASARERGNEITLRLAGPATFRIRGDGLVACRLRDARRGTARGDRVVVLLDPRREQVVSIADVDGVVVVSLPAGHRHRALRSSVGSIRPSLERRPRRPTGGSPVARSVAVTFDYRCPFAYNGNLAVINAIREGSDIEFRFVPFSLDQVPRRGGRARRCGSATPTTGAAGMRRAALRDRRARRVPRLVLRRAPRAVRRAPRARATASGRGRAAAKRSPSAGLDADAVAEEAWSGRPLKTLATEHTECVERYGVFGVPTFLEGDQAAFVRFMDRGSVDDLERMLEFLTWGRSTSSSAPASPAEPSSTRSGWLARGRRSRRPTPRSPGRATRRWSQRVVRSRT